MQELQSCLSRDERRSRGHSTIKEMGGPHRLGHVSMGKEQRAVCGGSAVVEVEAAVLFKSGLYCFFVYKVIHREEE